MTPLLLAAATLGSSPATPPAQKMVDVVVPRSQLNLEKSLFAPPTSRWQLLLAANTWAPTNFKINSLLESGDELRPQLAGVFVALGYERVSTGRRSTLRPIVSAAYRGFSREGNLEIEGFQIPRQTYVPAFALGAGLELVTHWKRVPWLKPYLGLGGRGHALVISQFTPSSDSTLWGYSALAYLGTEIRPWTQYTIGLDLSFQTERGLITGKSLRAQALQGGIRWNF